MKAIGKVEGKQDQLRIGAVALAFGVHTVTIHRWIAQKKLVATRTLGNHRRITRDSFNKLAAKLGVRPSK